MNPATHAGEDFEIGRILHLRSEIIRNPKCQIGQLEPRRLNVVASSGVLPVQFEVSDFGSEMQDSEFFAQGQSRNSTVTPGDYLRWKAPIQELGPLGPV